MNVHKHARMTSHGRLLSCSTHSRARLAGGGGGCGERRIGSHGLQVAGAASDGAASPPSTTGARRRPVAAPNAGRDRRRHRAIAPSTLERTADRAPPERPHPIAHRALDRIEPTVEKMFVRGDFRLLSRRTNAIADHGVVSCLALQRQAIRGSSPRRLRHLNSNQPRDGTPGPGRIRQRSSSCHRRSRTYSGRRRRRRR